MHNYPAGAEMERGGGFILYSMHSERPCVFPHKLRVLILQIPSSCWGFAFFLCFQKNSYPPVGAFFDSICLFLQQRWNFTRWFLLCRILASWTGVTLQLWTCAKDVRKQSVPKQFQDGLHYSFGHVWSMYRSSPFRSKLNTGYITTLDMCEVCTQAVHYEQIECGLHCSFGHVVELWKTVTLQLWTCVKYVPKQSIP